MTTTKNIGKATTPIVKNSGVKNVNPLAKALKKAATRLAMSPKDLTTWLSQYPHLSQSTQESFLGLISEYGLNPRADELDLVQFETGCWQVFITINGWAKLINAHPAFCGIEFSEASKLEEGVPVWMGCTIYRTDRIKPIAVKEYFAEMKTEHAAWQQMPRRMLRHRAMQQCARLAFGITVPECKSAGMEVLPSRYDIKSLIPDTKSQSALSHSALLKARLLREGQITASED